MNSMKSVRSAAEGRRQGWSGERPGSREAPAKVARSLASPIWEAPPNYCISNEQTDTLCLSPNEFHEFCGVKNDCMANLK